MPPQGAWLRVAFQVGRWVRRRLDQNARSNVRFPAMNRPAGVTAIGILLCVQGVLIMLLPGIRFRGIGILTGLWQFGLCVLVISVGVGLLRRRPWARFAAIGI